MTSMTGEPAKPAGPRGAKPCHCKEIGLIVLSAVAVGFLLLVRALIF